MKIPRAAFVVLLTALVLLLGGCFGSTVIRQNFSDYSQTLHYNSQQQMLQNLVYLKYRETPFFMKVGALSVNYELTAGSQLGLDDLRDANSPVALGLDSGFLEKPTVTYTPVEGDVFVKQMLTEIDPDVFALLIRSGWPVDTLCRLTMASIGDKPADSDSNSPFRQLVQQLAAAQADKTLDIRYADDPLDNTNLPNNTSQANNTDKPASTALVISTPSLRIPLSAVRFRSFLDVMYELSKNVAVPAKHSTWVRDAADANGLIRIQPSLFRPGDSYVSIVNHGYYFSIAQDDVTSKDIFALLQVLYQMQAGEVKGVQPVLTLPVGG